MTSGIKTISYNKIQVAKTILYCKPNVENKLTDNLYAHKDSLFNM